MKTGARRRRAGALLAFSLGAGAVSVTAAVATGSAARAQGPAQNQTAARNESGGAAATAPGKAAGGRAMRAGGPGLQAAADAPPPARAAGPAATPAAATPPKSTLLVGLLGRVTAAGDEAAGRTAVEAFWREVKARGGTPLVEPAPGSPGGYYLVTFLYRGGDTVRSVGLVANMDGADRGNAPLALLPGTDVWHRTYRLRGDAALTYMLEVNGPSGQPMDRMPLADLAKRFAAIATDPLNPRRTPAYTKDPDKPSDRTQFMSLARLPKARQHEWSGRRPGVPRGRLTLHRFKSARLKGWERRAWVYTPPGYDPAAARPYPLVMVLDGRDYLHWVPTPVVLDNLIAAGRIPPVVAVLLDTVDDRRSDLACAPAFADSLASELVPWMRSRWRVTNDPGRTLIAGTSLGGLAAAYVGLRRPDTFGRVLSQTGSFWYYPGSMRDLFQRARPVEVDAPYGWLQGQYAARPRRGALGRLRFYLDVGLLEKGGFGEDGPSQVLSSRHMRDVLVARGYPVTYREHNQDHNTPNSLGLATGLVALLGAGPAPE